jgi:RHS repeat-associated protein
MEVHNKKQGKGKNPHDPAGELTRVQEYYYGNGFLLAAKTIDKPEKHGYGFNHGNGRGGSGKGWGNIDPLKDVTFYHQDALGSVVMLTGHNGQVVERYEYDVYGVAYNGKFDHGLAGMGGNPYGFTGKRYEPETGIYSFAFRDYNPRSIRWMTEDPVKDGMNWYEYCGSDPVNWVDLLGLCGEIIEKAWKAVPDPLAEVEFSIYATQGSMTFIGDENISLPAFGSTTIRIDGTVGVTIDDDDTTRMVVDLDVTANTSTSWSPETDVEMKVGLSANVTVRDDAGTPGNIFDDSVKSQDVPLGILDVTHGLEGGDNNITASTVMRIGNESIIDIQPDRLTVSVELTVGFAPVGAPTFSRGQTVTGNVATIVLDEPGGADTNQIISVDF